MANSIVCTKILAICLSLDMFLNTFQGALCTFINCPEVRFRYVVVGCFAFISVGGIGGWFSALWRRSSRFSYEFARPVAKVGKYVGKPLGLLIVIIG